MLMHTKQTRPSETGNQRRDLSHKQKPLLIEECNTMSLGKVRVRQLRSRPFTVSLGQRRLQRRNLKQLRITPASRACSVDLTSVHLHKELRNQRVNLNSYK